MARAARRSLSLRARLLLIGVTGVAVALLVAGVGFYSALTVATDRTLDREALSSAREVAALVDEDRLPEAVPTSGAQLVQVVDAQQRVVAASLGADRLVPLLDPAQLEQALAGAAVRVDGGQLGSSGPLRVRAVAAGPADDRVAVVVAVQVGDVLAGRAALRTGLVVVFPVVLLVLAVVAWFVIGRTLRPVEQLRAGAERIGAGPGGPPETDPGARLPVPAAADEIRALALTLNGMLDRLAAARERQRAFVADAAHELRSPLTSLRVQLEVADRLGEGGDLPADLAPDLERLTALVEDLLLLARSGADSPAPAHPEAVGVRALLAEVAATTASRPGVVVAAAAPGTGAEPVVLADRAELRRVLVNLTSNAARHAETQVCLDALVVGGAVVLRVDDDGPGIAATERVRVFERFARLDDARSRDAGGSGLGLPIAAELVARAGGEVVLTDAPGGGLRAEVRLPAVG